MIVRQQVQRFWLNTFKVDQDVVDTHAPLSLEFAIL